MAARFKRLFQQSRRVVSGGRADQQLQGSNDGSHHESSNLYPRVESQNVLVTPDTFNPYQTPNTAPQPNRIRARARVSRVPGATIGELIPTSGKLLAPPTVCHFCSAKKFEFEPPTFCCSKGSIHIATNSFPDELLHLFTSDDDDSLHFQTYSRLYNNLFAFSSLTGSIDVKTTKGIYVFTLHGQLYHFLPNLLPQNEQPKFLQLYFYDAHFEASNRHNCFSDLRPSVINTLMSIMQCNPYANFFKRLKELHVDDTTTIYINKSPKLDQRVYNAPTVDEVAAIWVDWSAEADCTSPYIVVSGRAGAVHRIQHHFGCYDPLQYPLLFPFGESGWRHGIRKNSQHEGTSNAPFLEIPRQDSSTADELLAAEHSFSFDRSKQNISCREYYSYLLQIRNGNHILSTGRILLQFIVDMYVKLENTRLDFFKRNQSTIRADLYQGLLDTVVAGECAGANAGKRIILPPSFIGGPRDMKRRYLNAMALVQKYGKPDIFATMTCNPNWPEIKAELRDGEKAQHRPDLIARVFHAKLKTARKEIMEKKIFGEVAALIYVVEFQKRGLPHAHFLIILSTAHKLKSPEHFDRFVSAEIPSRTQPHLRSCVLNHMMHGPCGDLNPNCACMKDCEGQRVCKSRYPKDYAPYATNKDDGYPIYRRRRTGEIVTIRRHEMDNRWVIPYNPYLLAYFDCHFNVEVCSTIQAVKYLYKYVYKGHDRISFGIGVANPHQPVDEIEKFQAGRWLSPPEAAWRLFGFDLYEIHPPVMPLQIHCENMQPINFLPSESLEKILSDQRRCQTPLTEFFKMNASGLSGAEYLYSEFPQYFVWDDRLRKWKARKKGRMIGRLTFVSPSEADRFYLRLLLANVRAPTSFNALRTVNGIMCATFQDACIRIGLVEHCQVTEMCLDEAVQVGMPQSLRRLFATLLIFCHPPNPQQLWEKYYAALSEDFKQQYPEATAIVHSLTLDKLEQHLECMGKTLAEYNLQHLRTDEHESLRMTRDIRDAYDAPVTEEYIQARKQLNPKQRLAYKTIIQHVKTQSHGAFFIDGPGGTGKTFLYSALYAKVRLMNKIVIPTASSGIAAGCLPNGRTAHSRFKLPLDHNKSLVCDVPKQSGLAALIKEAALIIWDEAPMAHKENVQALDTLLRDLCDPHLLFGGKVVVLGGDFRQVLPVLPQKTQIEAVEASLVSSSLWTHFIKFHLDENMRAKDDPMFASFLLALGDGHLQEEEQALITLPSTIGQVCIDSLPNVDNLMQDLFLHDIHAGITPTTFNNRAILTAKNDEVDMLNKAFIDSFEGEELCYKSFDVMLDDHSHIYPVEFLNTLCPGGMSPHKLYLKKQCPVILLRNLDPSSGLCNGTRLICKEFFPNMIVCEISVGHYKGCQAMLPRINLRPPSSSNYPFQFERRQFPIKLCFAMTINKSQGQTLDEVGLFLQEPCFSHGQLYVALSRAKKASKVRVLSRPCPLGSFGGRIKNVVAFDVLTRAGVR